MFVLASTIASKYHGRVTNASLPVLHARGGGAPRRSHLGPHVSEAARRLRALVAWDGVSTDKLLSQNALAARLGARSGDVNRWLWCQTRPGREWAVEIERIFPQIKVVLWSRAPQKPIEVLHAV